MEKVLPLAELLAINRDANGKMFPPFRHSFLDLARVHLGVIHVSVPCTERRARWRANHPIGVVLIDELPREEAILTLAEIPRASVGLLGPKVESVEAL